MAALLQVERVQEEEAARADKRADGYHRRSGEGSTPEEMQLDQRISSPWLVRDQRAEREQGERDEPDRLLREPACRRRLDDRVGERRQQDDHQDLADRVRP